MEEENQFIPIMEKHSNEKLIHILTTDQEGFQPAALAAAKVVLDSRGLTDNEHALIEEKIVERERKEKIESTKHRSLLKGPGIVVTIIILVPLMLFTPNRTFMVTMLFAMVGFGAGHGVNYLYFKNKKTNKGHDELDQLP